MASVDPGVDIHIICNFKLLYSARVHVGARLPSAVVCGEALPSDFILAVENFTFVVDDSVNFPLVFEGVRSRVDEHVSARSELEVTRDVWTGVFVFSDDFLCSDRGRLFLMDMDSNMYS